MKVNLRTQSVSIRAPRSAVSELISSFGDAVDGSGPSGKPEENEESKRLIERDGNRLLMEFRSQEGRKMYRTLEEVVLYPEERITFRHLEDPLYHSQEEFVFTEVDSGTIMTHNGEIECRMHLLPGAGWMVARLYVKRRYERLVLRQMQSLKETAEAKGAD